METIGGIEMNHYTYKLTNQTNDMLYIGVRSCQCEPLEDTGYMSSSKYVKAAEGEFAKEIIAMYETRAEAELAEMKMLTEVDAKNNECYYNMCNGAEKFTTQGLTKENSKAMRINSEKIKLDWSKNRDAKIATIHHEDRDYTKAIANLDKTRGTGKSTLKGEDRTDDQLAQARQSSIRMASGDNPAHSTEAQAKRIATITGRKRPRQAELMRGRTSIGKEGVYKRVKKEELDQYIADGWVVGLPPRVKSDMKEKTCPHCGKIGKGPNMSRYHFDKCKLKGTSNE